MIYQVVYKCLAELKLQLREGLDVLGLVKLMETHSKVSGEIFKTTDAAAVRVNVLRHRVEMDAVDGCDVSKKQVFTFFLDYLEETCVRESGM